MGSVTSLLYTDDSDVFGRTSFALSIKDAALRNEYVVTQRGRVRFMSLLFAFIAVLQYLRTLMEFLAGKNILNGGENNFLDGPLPFIHTGLIVTMFFFMGL